MCSAVHKKAESKNVFDAPSRTDNSTNFTPSLLTTRNREVNPGHIHCTSWSYRTKFTVYWYKQFDRDLPLLTLGTESGKLKFVGSNADRPHEGCPRVAKAEDMNKYPDALLL